MWRKKEAGVEGGRSVRRLEGASGWKVKAAWRLGSMALEGMGERFSIP